MLLEIPDTDDELAGFEEQEMMDSEVPEQFKPQTPPRAYFVIDLDPDDVEETGCI